MVKIIKNIQLIIIIICIIILIYCGYGFLRENILSDGYILYENIRMASAGNGGINLSEKDAYTISQYIESLHTAENRLYLKGFLFGLTILLFASFQIFIENKKKKP